MHNKIHNIPSNLLHKFVERNIEVFGVKNYSRLPKVYLHFHCAQREKTGQLFYSYLWCQSRKVSETFKLTYDLHPNCTSPFITI